VGVTDEERAEQLVFEAVDWRWLIAHQMEANVARFI
jgi:hypothetical protein